ncbi:hypothetical protein G2W53_027593 [Senna tora]|uniref:Uncharacterized protein n=1 Tax=Senna tora TaxID=362788 RepID=A0A834WIK0_9FABA|nr:hypothetical protein G2W53_027593 [Senna tora]
MCMINFLQHSGFENVLGLFEEHITCSWYLIDALASMYDPQAQVFNFGQAFSFHYIRPLCSLFDVEVPEVFLSICGWAIIFNKIFRNSFVANRFSEFKDFFMKLTPCDIRKTPYKYIYPYMPQHYKEQRKMGLAILPCFNMEFCLFYRPFVCKEKFMITNQGKNDMRSWMKEKVKASWKNVLLTATSLRGTKEVGAACEPKQHQEIEVLMSSQMEAGDIVKHDQPNLLGSPKQHQETGEPMFSRLKADDKQRQETKDPVSSQLETNGTEEHDIS